MGNTWGVWACSSRREGFREEKDFNGVEFTFQSSHVIQVNILPVVGAGKPGHTINIVKKNS